MKQSGVITSLLALAFLAGCESTEKLEGEFHQRRQQRYEVLRGMKEEEKDVDKLETLEGELSLERSIDLALKYSKDVQEAKLELLVAKGQMTEAISTAMPKASLGGQALAVDNSYDESKESYALQVLARQPLYLGGLFEAALDAATVYAYQSQQKLRQSMQRVQMEVQRKYKDALLARELIGVSEEAKRNAEQSLRDTEKKQSYGAGTKFEVLRAQVRLRSIEADLIKLRNSFEVTVAELLRTLGVSQRSRVNLSDSLVMEPVAVDVEKCLEYAMTRRADLLIGEAQVRLLKDNVESERSEDRPKVFLQGEYTRSYPGFTSFIPGQPSTWDRTMNGGLVMEWPVFDGFRTAGRVAQAKARQQQEEVSLRRTEELVQFQVKQSLLNLIDSQEYVRSQEGNVATAEESLRLSRVNYREGSGTSLDVITAEAGLAQAKSDYISAVHAYDVSKLQLLSSIGVIGEEPIPMRTENAEPVSDGSAPGPVEAGRSDEKGKETN